MTDVEYDTLIDEYMEHMTRFTELVAPIIVRAVEAKLISPVEQAEFATFLASMTQWYERLQAAGR